jgi:hypothetical protein
LAISHVERRVAATSVSGLGLTTTVDDALAFGGAALRNRTHTPGAGYTERAEVAQGSGGDTAGAAVEVRP